MSTDSTQKHIRASSVLLCGRMIGVGLNFLNQVLVVRYLTTQDYGAWAFAFAAITLCGTLSTLAFDRAIDRFIPIYHETKQYGKLFGTLLFVAAAIAGAGLLIAGGFYLAPSVFSSWIPHDASMALLFVLVVAVPFDALDTLLVASFASLARPSAIFFRKHLLGPGLKLLVVLLLILLHADVTFLAYGYVLSSVISVTLCAGILIRLLRQEGLFAHVALRDIEFPVREIVYFTVPLISSQILVMLFNSGSALLIGFFHTPEQVAMFRVVVPVAAMNFIVRDTFAIMFTAHASRMFARGEMEGIGHLYWQSTIWITVLTFPIFALTFGASESLTVLLFGSRYASSGMILALLAVGSYMHVVFGFSQLTLKALGKIRQIVLVDLLASITFLVLNLLLVPRFGAIGAAVGNTAAMIAYAIYRQVALYKSTGLSIFGRERFSFHRTLILCIGILLLGPAVVPGNVYAAVFLVGVASITLLASVHKQLQIDETFPELRRLLRPIYGAQ
jgi:O-antigen/teichoic acid export membrane protein